MSKQYSACVILFSLSLVTIAGADDALDTSFLREIRPLLNDRCFGCHGEQEQEAKLDLSGFKTAGSVAKQHQIWEIVLTRLEKKEMPPEDARPLSDAERGKLIKWIKAIRRREAERNAGDPGVVLARRLNNSEYNFTVRDLTGVDIRPARTFPVDPANEEGFDNSGESLAMSPALLKKYLDAAREVSNHLVLLPEGLTFATHPVVTKTDRDKFCVKRIVSFYQRQPTDLAKYFEAAWWYAHRESWNARDKSLDDVADAHGVSSKYLKLVYKTLTEPESIGPLAELQKMWHELPKPASKSGNAPTGIRSMVQHVQTFRKRIQPRFPDLYVNGAHRGSQPFVLWKNQQYAAQRRQFLTVADERALFVAAGGGEPRGKKKSKPLPPRKPLETPAGVDATAYRKAIERFCHVFPDTFYVSERGRDYLGVAREDQEKGRLLSAGFHSMMGYFRDDSPLYELVLDEDGQRELDGLWQQLDFVASAPMRQYSGFLWFERTDSRYMRDPQFDFARPEDKDAISEKKIKALAKVYLEKARQQGGKDIALKSIDDYFRDMNRRIRQVEADRLLAEPSHIAAMLTLAERAYRHPLTAKEKKDLQDFYRRLRADDGLSHEEAIQDVLVSILMTPAFLYRMDLAAEGKEARLLTDEELASRLSYFLWSSMPDRELLRAAAAGELRDSAQLDKQVERMLQDERVRALGSEFAASWLDVQRFEQHNSVDRNKFPQFTNELRAAMAEEPQRFFLDVVQNDRSILSFLYARHTFVNPILARHYGIPQSQLKADREDGWGRIDDATAYQRGGLLPMAAFLTKNAPGLRTSPVKRGYWVVRRILGERIPPPPPNVPELPADETKLGELTLRETLAKHREHKSCAVCHDRFDSLGVVFENYDPIGQLRKEDLGGRPVDTRAIFPGGREGKGIDGLRAYLKQHRQQEFVRSLSRKLLSYALGRSLLLSDKPLLEQMERELARNEFRFSVLIKMIIRSEQFRNKRGV